MSELRWTPLGPPAPPPLPPPVPVPVTFVGDRSEFRRLVTRGAGLELITVGFYRFWLATDIRRHLWSNTLVDGDAAEYTGRGKELLIGFLFALAIIVPIYLAYFVASIEVERVEAFASLPLFAFFYLFGQFASYRARRYRLTRTVWRGVRFWMDGSGWAYAARAALWTLLMPLTLGLILPWRAAALERYKMRHCFYGDLQGSFEGRGSDFFKRGWGLWLLAMSALLVLAMARILPFGPLVLIVTAPFVYAAFKVVEWRWWVSGIRFGRVRFESDLPRGALASLYWKVIGWSLLFSLLFGAYLFGSAALIATIDKTSLTTLGVAQSLQDSVPMIVLAAIGYLTLILAMNVVIRIYLMRDLWMRVARTVTVHDLEHVENVVATGELANAIGEGLADGLDVVGF